MEELKKVEANLRSVTQSCKGGVPFESLERDYKDLLGVSIPYKALGYFSLEAMIKSMPDVVSLQRNAAGKAVVMAVADKTTAHIASLIARQKSAVRRPIARARRPLRVQRERGSVSSSSRQSVRHFNKGSRPSASPLYSQREFETHSSSSCSPDNEIQEISRNSIVRGSKQVQNSRAKGPATATFGPGYEVPPRFRNKEPLSSLENNNAEDHYQSNTATFSYSDHEPTVPAPGRRTVAAGSRDAYFQPPLPDTKGPPLNRSRPSVDIYRPPSSRYEQPTNRSAAATCGPEPASMVEVIEHYAQRQNIIACYRTLPLGDSYIATLCLGDRKFHSCAKSDELTAKESCAAVAVEHLNWRGSAIEFVENYARINKLHINFKHSSIGQKRKSFVSVLTLGDKQYRIYPDVAPTQEAADEAAAVKAKTEILLSEATQTVLPVAELDDSENLNQMLNRVDEIVAKKPKGIWNTSIPTEYEMLYHQRLPENWFAFVKEHCSFYYEKVDDSRIILYSSSNSGRTSPISVTSGNQDDENSLEDLERKFPSLSVPVPVLEVPEADQFDVFITNVQDAHYIAVRLVDYANEFEALSEKMNLFYENNKYPVSSVTSDKPYAVFVFGLWHRAMVEDMKDDIAVCQLVDEGEIVEVDISSLQEMDSSFLSLPFQVVTFNLAELECYSKYVKPQTVKDYLLGKSLVAKVVDSERTSVVLYDTSTDEDINLNRIIFEKTVAECLSYTLPECGATSVAFLSHVSPCGTVYLTFNHPSTTNLFLEELSRITPICQERAKEGCDTTKDCLYCAEYDSDPSWYRAVILDSTTEKDQVEVLYVDYGNTSWVSLNSICELKPVSEYLAELPFQAVRCKLSELPPDNLHWSSESIKRLTEITPFDKELIVRVQKPGTENDLPEVELFVRNDHSLIISVNQTLLQSSFLYSNVPNKRHDRLSAWAKEFLPEFNKTDYTPGPSSQHRSHVVASPVGGTVNEEGKLSNAIPDVCVSAKQELAKKQGNWVPVSTSEGDNDTEEFPPLYPPDVPENGSLFNVFVTMAASPFNFMCQPLKSSQDLDKLFSEMQSFYSNEENLCEMHSVLVKEREFFSGKHADGNWYRVRKQSIVSEDPLQVSVYFVDFGDMMILPLPNLQPLFKQFRSLPCQCMKASLKGVKPNGHDWEPMQCFEFRKMVEEKSFASIVESKQLKVEEHLTIYLLELVLVDVSDPRLDVCVHEELIKSNLAQPT